MFERRHRANEAELAYLGFGNRTLYALFNYWNVLEQYRKDVIEHYRGKAAAYVPRRGHENRVNRFCRSADACHRSSVAEP